MLLVCEELAVKDLFDVYGADVHVCRSYHTLEIPCPITLGLGLLWLTLQGEKR